MKVKLYTRQSAESYEILKKTGKFSSTREHLKNYFTDIAEHILNPYDWLVKEVEERLPGRGKVEYPIWCAIREKDCWLPIEDTVVYEIEIEESEVLYFCDGLWDYALNTSYLPADEKDAKRYKEFLDSIGRKGAYEFFLPKYKGKFPREEAEVRDSWKRIFLNPDVSKSTTKAFIWEINFENVIKVHEYK